MWSSRHFDERMDGIVYGARAGLGFALVENCVYLYAAATTQQLALVWVLRAVLAVPGHALWTGMLGYCAARRRFDHAGPTSSVSPPGRRPPHHPHPRHLLGWKLMRAMARTALHLDDADAARR